jgi:hypothetical protein
MTGVGTWVWGQRTGGRMRRRDQLDQLLRAARARIALARRTGPAMPVGAVTVAERPPDTAFAGIAFEVARAASSDALLHHCLRTWLWADLVAQADRVPHDPELLYVSCVLHDLGLTPRHWCDTDACFGVEGARAAHELATASGYPRADALADAISLHLNVTVPLGLGAEAHLVHAGAAMDVVDARARRLPAVVRGQVLGRHPREGFLDELLTLGARQVAARPRSRIALLHRIGFADLMRTADRRFSEGPGRSG